MTSTMKAQSEYISVGANRHTAVADWSEDGLLAFGADVNVALWKPTDSTSCGIQILLSGHKDVIKVVKFIPKTRLDDTCSYLITGADDKTLRVWRINTQISTSECVQVEESHTAAINCISVTKTSTELSEQEIIIATGGADATIRIWKFDNASQSDSPLKPVQMIKTTPKFFPLCLSVSELGAARNGSYVLAAAGTRNTIHIYIGDTADSDLAFTSAATLSGHEGWIRSLDISPEPRSSSTSASSPPDLLLASASQDKYIRLWRIHAGHALPPLSTGAESAFAGGARSPANKAHRINSSGAGEYSVTFEALLLGHEDWIYSARWHTNKSVSSNKLQLLSTSADNSLAIWEPDVDSGIWLSAARLGEISREKGATTATGSTGGFWTGLWSPDGTAVVTLGRTGGWRMWRRSPSTGAGPQDWKQFVAIGGHIKPVTGVTWEKNGRYLLSTSHDQTTRLHARWKGSEGQEKDRGYHELARPQIHGYDLNCISTLSPTSFVSGADEKLMRVFKMPKGVADLLSRVSGISATTTTPRGSTIEEHPEDLPNAANMPVLGLSNKATDTDGTTSAPKDQPPNNTEATEPSPSALSPSYPPHEDILSRHSLFPETEKLYGHGYEISCLSANSSGTLIASACKATSLEHAVIRLFETEKWTEVTPPLKMHGLTCTRVRFSSGGREDRILSVGRDRAWGVFEKQSKNKKAVCGEVEGKAAGEAPEGAEKEAEEEKHRYELKYSNLKAHSRMINDCAWAPSGNSFVTAGRDRTVKFWKLPPAASLSSSSSSGPHLDSTSTAATITGKTIVTESSPVTAVDFLPFTVGCGPWLKKLVVLAVGTEVGRVSVHIGSEDGDGVFASGKECGIDIDYRFNLPKAVHQLAWRPSYSGAPELAVAGEDGSLRIISFPGLLDVDAPASLDKTEVVEKKEEVKEGGDQVQEPA
ncbi:elongator protein 2 [Zalerion maritima]|uniref:Elongator complex protein 2 n=1 Tax=Zalerion maritima TaxID=339359 RepID=A0AAD5RSV2_9PEZI|nr:elongator protein 2 [Zalerion maritima]